MMLIELYGLPGSGKTYLTKSLEKRKKDFLKRNVFIYSSYSSFLSYSKKFITIVISLPLYLFSNFY